MAAGREAKGSRLEPQAQSSENKLEMAQVFGLSKPTVSDILLPTRPYLLSLPTQCPTWGPGFKYMELWESISFKSAQGLGLNR